MPDQNASADLPYRVCSGCARKFTSEADYMDQTCCAGVLCTGDYADFNLKLRNCKSCGSTLSTKVFKLSGPAVLDRCAESSEHKDTEPVYPAGRK